MEGLGLTDLVHYTDIPGSELHYGLRDGKDEEVLAPASGSAGAGSTRNPRLVNRFRLVSLLVSSTLPVFSRMSPVDSDSPSYAKLLQMKTLAGIHLMSQSNKKKMVGGTAPIQGQSPSHVKLARGVSAPGFR